MVASRNEPSSSTRANSSSWLVVRVTSPVSRGCGRPVSASASEISSGGGGVDGGGDRAQPRRPLTRAGRPQHACGPGGGVEHSVQFLSGGLGQRVADHLTGT